MADKQKNPIAFAKLRYREHRGRCKGAVDKNGDKIEFLLTFEQWYDIWLTSGKWEQRGRSSGQYVMSRYNDVGPYSVDNVFIQLHSNNSSQGKKGRPNPPSAIASMSAKKRGRTPWNKGRKGVYSEESIKRMVESAKARVRVKGE